MIENKKFSNDKKFVSRLSTLAVSVALAAGTLSAPVSAENFSMETDSGWGFGVNGHIPVFAVLGDFDQSSPGGAEDSFRITTGFNPATLQTNVYAPMQNGVEVSGHFQMNANLSTGDADSDFRSRVAEIAVGGDFGKVNIGKGFGIFGVPAIGDNGSALGVGLIAAGNPADKVSATAGRIGNGYFYADFTPRVMYTSNSFGGLQFKVGVFSPLKPVPEAETSTPRLEANLVYSTDVFSLWTSGFTQDVDSKDGSFDDYTMSGVDFGGSVSVGGLGVRANYSVTKGTGNFVYAARLDPEEEDASQWYVETTYDFGRTTLGASYGEGEDDFTSDAQDSELTMVFARFAATDALTLMAEVQDSATDGGNNTGDYNAYIVGAQLTF